MTGWLLIAGPVLTFIVIGILYTGLVGNQETPADSVKEMMAAPDLSRLLLRVGSVVFVCIFLGLTLLSRSMQGDDKPGAAYASVAGIIFTGLAALGIGATGLSAGALEAAATSEALAVNIEAVSVATFSGLWFFWGIGSLLLGSAMLMQKNLHVVLAWMFTAFGVFVIITSLIDIDLPDTVGFVVWIAMTVVVAASGVLTLKTRQAS